jgi:hypothetical protein
MVLPEAVADRVFDEHDLVAVGQRADRDLRQAHRRHDPADHQSPTAGRLHRLHERGRLPRVLCVPIDRRDVGEFGSERRNRRSSHPHFDADCAQDDRDVEPDGELCEAAGVEFEEPSILLEDLRQHTVLVVDQQQRAITRVPDGTTVVIHFPASHSSCGVRLVGRLRSVFARSRARIRQRSVADGQSSA